MNPELYQRINELVHSAVERPANERAAFLDEACGADAALREKVEALIAAYEKSGEFLDSPAYELEAQALVDETPGSLVGEHLGRYQVLSVIGQGGMGTVYLAHDTRLHRKVALKVLRRRLTSDERRAGRFRREARAASGLNHPNIVTIYEMEEVGGTHFIATEYVEGITLRQRLKDGPLPTGEALDLALQVAEALSHAHRCRIIHRDIKPENIMLGDDGRVKVLDFGLAKFISPAQNDDATTQTAYSTPGLILGTIAYMSPEQARGLTVDARTDIWSLGVVLYEMLTANLPFAGPTRSDALAAILQRTPEPLATTTRQTMPDKLDRIVARALQKNLDDRYQTVEEFASALREVQPATAPRINLRKRALLVVCSAILLAVLAAVAWWFSRPTAPATNTAAIPERRLVYSLLVQKYRDGKPYEEPFAPNADINFEPDYRVRLLLRSDQPGYLYVLNEQLAPATDATVYKILFPSPTANAGRSLLEAKRELQIPEESWFRFDDKRGTEKIWIVWSAASVAPLEAIKRFANPRDRGVVNNPELNAAVQTFLATRPEPSPVAERAVGQKEVVIKASGDILAHLLRLEHH